MTVSLHPRFVAIKYPGYFWDTENKKLYSIKVEGVLKPLTLVNPNKHNRLSSPAYRISYKNSPRYVFLDRLMSLKPKDRVIDVTPAPTQSKVSPYWINTSMAYHFSMADIERLEKHYGVKYMGFWTIKTANGNWSEHPVDVFYQPNPDKSKGHSNYLGVFKRNGDVFLTNAESAFSEDIFGKLVSNNEVIVSRYRHDYIEIGSVIVDGGRDYFRASAAGKTIKISVKDGQFVFTPA